HFPVLSVQIWPYQMTYFTPHLSWCLTSQSATASPSVFLSPVGFLPSFPMVMSHAFPLGLSELGFCAWGSQQYMPSPAFIERNFLTIVAVRGVTHAFLSFSCVGSDSLQVWSGHVPSGLRFGGVTSSVSGSSPVFLSSSPSQELSDASPPALGSSEI